MLSIYRNDFGEEFMTPGKSQALGDDLVGQFFGLYATGGGGRGLGLRGAAKEGAYVNLASESRTAHILAGDATGGGHAWFGSGKSFMNGLTGRKTMFPMSWSKGKIMDGISEVVTSNPWIQQTGRAGAMFTRSGHAVRYVTEGFYGGIKIRVVNTSSEIITAFRIK